LGSSDDNAQDGAGDGIEHRCASIAWTDERLQFRADLDQAAERDRATSAAHIELFPELDPGNLTERETCRTAEFGDRTSRRDGRWIGDTGERSPCPNDGRQHGVHFNPGEQFHEGAMAACLGVGGLDRGDGANTGALAETHATNRARLEYRLAQYVATPGTQRGRTRNEAWTAVTGREHTD
jgi:hypothetical protein